MSWGYGCNTGTLSQDMQRNKELVRTTGTGTKIYKTGIGNGVCRIVVFWHDNRLTGLYSHLIIKGASTKHFVISELKTQKAVFEFAECKIKEFRL